MALGSGYNNGKNDCYGYIYDVDGALSLEETVSSWDVFLKLIKNNNLKEVKAFLSSHSYAASHLASCDNLPMRLAVEYGKTETLDFLLQNAFVKDAIQIHNNIALREAVKYGKWECAAILCHHNADISVLSSADQQKVQQQYVRKYGIECPISWWNKLCTFVPTLIFAGPDASESCVLSAVSAPAESVRKLKSSM